MVAPNWRMKKYDFVGWLVKKKINGEIYEYISKEKEFSLRLTYLIKFI